MNRKWLFFDRLSNRFSLCIRGIEFLVAAILVFFAVVSAVNLVISAMPELTRVDILFDYDYFQELLSYLLLLIIALELAIMLVKHNSNNVLEVMIYAIARKLLISNTTAVEILLGVLSIVILFAVRVYLEKGKLPLQSLFQKQDPPAQTDAPLQSEKTK